MEHGAKAIAESLSLPLVFLYYTFVKSREAPTWNACMELAACRTLALRFIIGRVFEFLQQEVLGWRSL